eukprot:TRINITY_DN78617_c0_g1_i1.p1 TRINITY_DN78617_c0_g1~~TRINITY_DN78617_c0_g1_i1.p1  ORF type:complete len:373 (-),score=122.27 TRINITY_DN78617_c0_g1_i1:183-1301(-)
MAPILSKAALVISTSLAIVGSVPLNASVAAAADTPTDIPGETPQEEKAAMARAKAEFEKRAAAKKSFEDWMEKENEAANRAQAGIAKLKDWSAGVVRDTQDKAKIQSMINDFESKAEDSVKSERSDLESKYASAVHELESLGHEVNAPAPSSSPSPGPVFDEHKFEDEYKLKQLVEKAGQLSKDLFKVEKKKASNMKKQYNLQRKDAKGQATEIWHKEVNTNARFIMHAARKVESFGRKAGQPESVYEGGMGKAEKISEGLSEDAEHIAEHGQDLLEHYYEKVEESVEKRMDEITEKAEHEADERKKSIQDAKKGVKSEAVFLAASSSTPEDILRGSMAFPSFALVAALGLAAFAKVRSSQLTISEAPPLLG